MKIKTLFAVLLAALMAVILIFGATSCEAEHKHDFEEWQPVSEPTCTAFGLDKRSCECGYTEYATIGALPHTPVTDAAVSATCTTHGKTEGSHCFVCNTVITAQTDVATLPHTFSDWKTVVAPTCTAFGLNERVCECGQTEYATVAATAHTPVTDPAVGATCTTPGFTEGSHCSVCNTVIVAQTVVDKLAHNYSDWKTVVASTCTSFGLNSRACACGAVEYLTVAATAHTPVTDPAVGATCTTPGFTEGSHCSVCNTVIVEQTVVDKLAHNYSDWKTVVAPTCTSFGLNSRACACGEIEYLTVAATAHTPVTDPAVGATCTTAGKTEGSHCSACGVVFAAQGYIAPTGHNCDEMAVIEEALCNLDGTKRYSCSNTGCDYYYDEAYALAETSGDEIFAKAKEYTGLIQTHDFLGSIIVEASAFVISPDGVIVTSNFALDNAFSAYFVLNGECYDVTDVLAYSAASSIAVLKVNATDLPYAPICVAEPTDAETVYTVGVLETHQYSISRGIISNANVSHGGRYIVHDADMSEGYRGGPLLNRFGEVIGINAAYDLDGIAYLNYSAWIAELENLDYSSPITIAEYGEATFTPSEYIAVWANSFANAYQNDISAYVVQGSDFYYAICNSNSGPFVEGYWVIDGTYKVNVIIKLGNCTGTYEYVATFSDGINTNETSGIIDAATFDASTLLTYESYYGRYWNEAELMALYTEKVYATIGWLSYCLESYFVDLTLADLGFTAVSYDRNEDALAKLNEFIMTLGAIDETTGMYSLSGTAQQSAGVLLFTLSHDPISNTTFVDVSYYLNNGVYYRLLLQLDPTADLGNWYQAHYGFIDEGEYYMQSYCWGYVDAANFTNLSTLTCYYIAGLEEYEDGLLKDYSMLVGYILDLLNTSVMPMIDPALSVKDLGFYFYFG